MLDISNKYFLTYEESLNNLYIDKLKKQVTGGLDGNGKNGILLDVLTIDQGRIEKELIPTHFEKNFTYKIGDLKFNGIIDRVDENLSNNSFDIVDYKTGKITPSEKKKEIEEGLSYQLTVYSEAFKEESKKELNEAGYYLLRKKDESEKVKFEAILKKNDDLIGISLKNLEKLEQDIIDSKYNYTTHDRESICKYCDYNTICRYDEEKAFIRSEKTKPENIVSLDANLIKKEMFFFPSSEKDEKKPLTEEQEKALDTERNIIVTAGAGAGKTQVLTNRMIKLLEKTNGDIEKILVITFTRKATSEMQNRIYSFLIKTIENQEDQRDKSFIKKARLHFQKNWISTIDAFYLRLLKENFLEFDLDNDIEISDKKELLSLIDETVVKKVDELAGKGENNSTRDNNLEKLLDIWNRDSLIEVLNKLVNVNWIEEFLKTDHKQKYVDIYQKQANIFLKKLDNISGQIPLFSDNDKKAVQTYIIGANNLIDFCRKELNRFLENPDSYIYEIPALKPGSYTKDVKEIIEDELHSFILDNIKPKDGEIHKFLKQCQFIKDEYEILTSLKNVLLEVKTEYEELKKERNIYTFDDVSRQLHSLLKGSKDVRDKLNKKFDFIMIDEFQDTNLYQYEIAKYLAGWDGVNPESIDKNKLFFVGDEKQAIYQFRGSDVQVFNTAKDEVSYINKIKGLDEEHVKFPHNFRSGKNLVNFFNKFFKIVLEKDYDRKKIYEAEPQDLKGDKPEGSINFFLFNKGKLRGERQNQESEPGFVAIMVKKLLEYKKAEDIAILFRTRKRIPLFASALEKAGINYVISGGTGFYENQEIIDLMNILSYLTDKRRTLELVGFLRSSFIGLSDIQLYEIRNNFSKGLRENHNNIHEMIKNWRELSTQLKTHQLIEKIVQDTNVKLPILSDSNFKQKLKNIERLIEITKANEKFTLKEFIEFVEFQIEEEIDESDGTIIELGEEKPVKLMSIHKAKGLGFSTVIIADVSALSYKEEIDNIHFGDLEIDDDKILREFIGLSVFDYENNSKEKTFTKKIMAELIKRKAKAELKRLLYVAMTRAKNNLIVTGSVWDGLGSINSSMMEFIAKYFDHENSEPLKEKFNMEDENNFIKIKDINFCIFNKNHDIKIEKETNPVSTQPVSIIEKIDFNFKPIYAYSNIKDKPELLRQLVNNYDEATLQIVPKKFENLVNVINPYHLNIPKEELDKEKMLIGNIIHKILEYRIESEELAENILRKNISSGLIKYSLQHFRNIKKILNEISSEIVTDYHELPFLSGQLTGIFDKLVRTKDAWEIWDYKISDASTLETVTKECEAAYKVQYLIYTQELAKLLQINDFGYKLLFSNFGVVDLVKTVKNN